MPPPVVFFADAISRATLTSLPSSADDLCVLQSSAGRLRPYAPVDPAADAAPSDGGATETSVSLYVDSAGMWKLSAFGQIRATVECAPWSAFNVAAVRVTRFDFGATYTDASSPVGTDLQGHQACFISGVQGDFGNNSNEAAIDGSSLWVANAASDGASVSVSCVDGRTPIPFKDFFIDGRAMLAAAAVPIETQALCGLSAIGGMNDPQSEIQIDQGGAIATRALATVRCFSFGAVADR